MNILALSFTIISSVAVGVLIFYVIIRFLPSRLKAENKANFNDIIAQAKAQAQKIKEENLSRLREETQIFKEELNENLLNKKEDLKIFEEDLQARENFLNHEEQRVKKLEHENEYYLKKSQKVLQSLNDARNNFENVRQDLSLKLSDRAAINSEKLVERLCQNLAENRVLEHQKSLKNLSDDLSMNAKRYAQRILARSLARYAPQFYWPKASNTVEIENLKIFEQLQSQQFDESLIAPLKALAEVEISFTSPEKEHSNFPPQLKLAGGHGIHREAAKLTLQEIIKKGLNFSDKFKSRYEYFKTDLEQLAQKLGLQAVTELKIKDLHPEILKMVGALNWRTSYRQNQYLHTVEVARLAGMLADELGIDEDQAKRVGLLHDIGKTIDYKIEGSHAVISGDYADRYGEGKVVCDVVMSHHNDLVVETPLAFVLKAADTLSGARPGARVNLEEGYQDRLSAIDEVVKSFHGITKSAIMNGGREIHIEVNNKRIKEEELERLAKDIAQKIETSVAFPGQIKVQIQRRFEATAVA